MKEFHLGSKSLGFTKEEAALETALEKLLNLI